ncbi:MAG: hypothetical protein ACKPKO_17710, partial [Candidatus Fonsibacter sp.]
TVFIKSFKTYIFTLVSLSHWAFAMMVITQKITNDTFRHLRTVMDMNDQAIDVVHEAKVPHYRWTSIVVLYVDKAIEVLGKRWRGKVLNVSVGAQSNGSFGMNGCECSSDGALLVSPASSSIGCNVRGKPWFLIQLASSRGENSIDGYD